jgi:hypothetical protein
MFMLVTLNPDAAMHHPCHADLVADIRFEVIGTHQLDAIWVFLVLQHLLAIFFGDAAGNYHLFAHGLMLPNHRRGDYRGGKKFQQRTRDLNLARFR